MPYCLRAINFNVILRIRSEYYPDCAAYLYFVECRLRWWPGWRSLTREYRSFPTEGAAMLAIKEYVKFRNGRERVVATFNDKDQERLLAEMALSGERT